MPTHPSRAAVFRADHTPFRMCPPVVVIHGFRPRSPAIHIIISHHIQLFQKIFPRGPRLRTYLIICLCRRSAAIQFPADCLQSARRQSPLFHSLIWDFISDTPDYNARMIPVPQQHRPNIGLMTLVKPFRIPSAFMCITAELFSFQNPPLVKRFVHHKKSHPVTQVQKSRIRRIYGTSALHLLPFFLIFPNVFPIFWDEPPLLYNLRHDVHIRHLFLCEPRFSKNPQLLSNTALRNPITFSCSSCSLSSR